MFALNSEHADQGGESGQHSCPAPPLPAPCAHRAFPRDAELPRAALAVPSRVRLQGRFWARKCLAGNARQYSLWCERQCKAHGAVRAVPALRIASSVREHRLYAARCGLQQCLFLEPQGRGRAGLSGTGKHAVAFSNQATECRSGHALVKLMRCSKPRREDVLL